MSTELVRFVEIETYVHATESIDKIVEAIRRNILQGEEVPIIFEVLWGTFGNPIVRVKIFVDNEALAERILLNVSCKLKNFHELAKTIEQRLDKAGNLYIRVNKQALIEDQLILDDINDDVVRIKARIVRKVLKEGLLKILEDRCLQQCSQ